MVHGKQIQGRGEGGGKSTFVLIKLCSELHTFTASRCACNGKVANLIRNFSKLASLPLLSVCMGVKYSTLYVAPLALGVKKGNRVYHQSLLD